MQPITSQCIIIVQLAHSFRLPPVQSAPPQPVNELPEVSGGGIRGSPRVDCLHHVVHSPCCALKAMPLSGCRGVSVANMEGERRKGTKTLLKGRFFLIFVDGSDIPSSWVEVR